MNKAINYFQNKHFGYDYVASNQVLLKKDHQLRRRTSHILIIKAQFRNPITSQNNLAMVMNHESRFHCKRIGTFKRNTSDLNTKFPPAASMLKRLARTKKEHVESAAYLCVCVCARVCVCVCVCCCNHLIQTATSQINVLQVFTAHRFLLTKDPKRQKSASGAMERLKEPSNSRFRQETSET